MTSRGTKRQSVRCDDPRWDRFGASAEKVASDRSALLRAFMDYFNGDTDVIPVRPKDQAAAEAEFAVTMDPAVERAGQPTPSEED